MFNFRWFLPLFSACVRENLRQFVSLSFKMIVLDRMTSLEAVRFE